MRRLYFPLAILIATLFGTNTFACNIPVFRYALERWRPDKLELLVFHTGELNHELGVGSPLAPKTAGKSPAKPGDQAKWAAKLANLTATANLKLTMVDMTASRSTAHAEIWQQLNLGKRPDEPVAVLRGKHVRGEFTCWSGSLLDADRLITSPARDELSRRMLSGHSLVWLVILSENATKNRPLQELLNAECDRLSDDIELPEGIGLPGSELFSEVPLLLRFSTLEIKRSDARELFLLKLAEGFQPAAYAAGEPLVVPVFGRGRALEVIPVSKISQSLVEDITMFLCGACSCQVKDQNPGFDLLIAADWEQELFGEAGSPAPLAGSIRPGQTGQTQAPVLLTIPSGRTKK